MKYYYLFNLDTQQPINAGYFPNKLILYTKLDNAKRGKVYYETYNQLKQKVEIKEVEI